jgi:transposase
VPWRESSFMSERLAFIRACLDRSERIFEVCDRFGISEKTGQKWLRRFREEGSSGLADRSRARLVQPYRITSEVAERIIALRRKYPLYGPAMLRDWLRLHEPREHWPAASSIGELLKRANLIRPAPFSLWQPGGRLRQPHRGRRRHLHHRLRLTRTRRLRFQHQAVYSPRPLEWLILDTLPNILLSITRMITTAA